MYKMNLLSIYMYKTVKCIKIIFSYYLTLFKFHSITYLISITLFTLFYFRREFFFNYMINAYIENLFTSIL